MSRVPDYPSKPIKAILTLQDYLDAGLVIRSFCSSGQGHSHVVDLESLVAERGPDVEVDYVLQRSLICPECGAPGGGLEIREG
jgi:hypothetical protein